MNNIDLERDKLFCRSKSPVNKNSKSVIAQVTNCLTDHRACTGRYIDYTNSFSVICDCHCHLQKEAINYDD